MPSYWPCVQKRGQMRHLLMIKLLAFLAAIAGVAYYVTPGHIERYQIPALASVPVPGVKPEKQVAATSMCSKWHFQLKRLTPMMAIEVPVMKGTLPCRLIDDKLTWIKNGEDI